MKTLVLAVGLLFQADAETFRRALAAGDFRAAWNSAESITDAQLRSRQEAEIFYRAGDPARALAAARTGLESSPENRELLYYAAGAAIWLQDGPVAKAYSERLREAFDSRQFAAEERTDWLRVITGFSQRSDEILAHDVARSAAVTRAVALAITSLLAGLVVCGLATRKRSEP